MSEQSVRRIIYLLLLGSIFVPLTLKWELPPAEMNSSDNAYLVIEDIEVDKNPYALVALDFGPGTQAENLPQADVVIEHLFRRRIPVVVFTSYALGERFAEETPIKVSERLMKEFPNEKWEYGSDWITLGYKPGGALFIQAFSQSDTLLSFLNKDSKGVLLSKYERFLKLQSIKDIKVAAEFTGLTGMLGNYIQFLQRSDYVPPLIHGCTSITIPETYIYLDSGQLKGAFEGVAGAAWYATLLSRDHLGRVKGDAGVITTALGSAHLLIIFLIIVGNLQFLRRKHG